jgi:4-carboxymuconolactone decarboxylase
MTHIAITGTINGKNVEWMEKVTEEQYNVHSGNLIPREPPRTAIGKKNVDSG